MENVEEVSFRWRRSDIPAEIPKHDIKLKVNSAAKKGLSHSHMHTPTVMYTHTQAFYSYLFMKIKGLSLGQLGEHN